MTRKRHGKTDPTRVSFRLDAEIAEELSRRAKEAGKSPGILARELLFDALYEHQEQRQELKMIRMELARLADSFSTIRDLRADLATSVRVLLVKAGTLTPDEAHRWVKQTLLSPKPQAGS